MQRIVTFVGTLVLLGSITGLPTAALAQSKDAKPVKPEVDDLMIKAGFLNSHPDLRYRLLGLEEFKRGKHEDALRFFQRSAYYGDKPSQGMVAEMFWNGQGAPKDPVLAYAWMDLAAERGYTGFLGLRERYWNALDENQRAQALEQGQAVYAKYGDAATQPRLARVLRRERREMTGSRTGFDGNLEILVPGLAGYEQIGGTMFFDEKFWDPEQYRAWHDSIWKQPRVGKVTVGEVQAADAVPGSRIPQSTPKVDAEEPTTPERDESSLGTRKDG